METRSLPATLRLGHAKARAEGEEPAVAETAAGVQLDEKGRIPVALSSELAVARYEIDSNWNLIEYDEVLEHTADAVDLTRAALSRGLPLFLHHNHRNPDCFAGKVEDITVDDDRVMRGWMRFSQKQVAQDAKQEVIDDLRSTVSIDYHVSDEYVQTEDKKTGRIKRTYKNWILLGLSLEPVPADPYVGVGRSASGERVYVTRAEAESIIAAHHAKEAQRAAELAAEQNRATTVADPAAPAAQPTPSPERSMETKETPAAATPTPAPAAAPVDLQVVRAEGEKANADRVARYFEIAGLTNGAVDNETIKRWNANNTSFDEALKEARDLAAKKANEPVKTVNAGLNAREARKFSYARAMLLQLQSHPQTASDPDYRKVDCGFEREVIADFAARHTQFAGKGSGNILPSMLMAQTAERMQMRTGLDTSSGDGAEFKFNQPGDFIELLRAHLLLYRAGATVIPGLTGPLVMPRQTSSGTLSWIADNPGSDTSISKFALDTVTLALKTAISVAAYTKQLLIQAAGNYAVEDLIRADLAETFAEGIDSVGLNGGGSNEPAGILQHTGIGSVTIGADGGAITYPKVVDLETTVANAKGDRGNLAYFSNPTVRGAAKKLYDVNSTYGTAPLWGSMQFPDGLMAGKMNGKPAFASTGVPSNLTKGTATTICSALIFGDVSQVLIGEFGGFDAFVDPYTLAAQGKIRVVGTQFLDVAIRQYQRLAAIKDIR